MIGVALEGGGALGAFHIGAMKALYGEGLRFDGYVGTSIGSINAAALAQGDFEGLEQLWNDISTEMLFSETVARLLSLGEYPLLKGSGIDLPQLLAGIRHGVDTTKMKAVIGALLNEDKLRASGMGFGLVTVRLNGLKVREMWLSDIPEGQLTEWVMASASFPGFRPEVIDGETYVDGGLRNNCPINLLTERGYDRVFAIRTHGPGVFHMPKTDAEIDVIAPSRGLGNVMLFEKEQSRRNMALGYLDARRTLGHTIGRTFFIRKDRPIDGFSLFAAADESVIEGAARGRLTEGADLRRLLFERILPDLAAYMKLGRGESYNDIALSLMEFAAESLGIDELREYGFKEFAGIIAGGELPIHERAPIPLLNIGDHWPNAIHALARSIAEKLA